MIEDNASPLLKEIDFGFEVEAFLQSSIGTYLTRRAEAEVEAAVDSLKRVDPSDTNAVRGLQSSIKTAENVLYWLAEAIQAGLNAQSELHDQSKEP